ncbi:MAG: efflux transporter outer membrane subunit [Deltaproteobacteria bacterium]|jgi:multidrug efflux system outer membrane protein|nr:efflux transporter outer membrane subunit [Deltaproteobacteria bacterium]
MKRLARTVALLAALSLSACSFAPKYERPDMPLPEEWNIPEQAQSRLAQKWWRRFKDPALNALVEEALEKNQDLEQALAAVNSAQAQLGVATSFLFPSAAAGGGWSKNSLSLKGPTPVPPGMRTQSAYSGGLSASWELDLWGKYRNAYTALSEILLGTQAAYTGMRLTTSGATVRSYFALLALDLQKSVVERTVKTREDALQIYTDRFSMGDITELDWLRAKAEVDVARVSLHQTLAALEAVEASLLTLLGRSPRDIMLQRPKRGRAIDLIPAIPILPAGLPSELLERRPDIRAAESALKAGNANIGSARADYFPSISLTGSLGAQSEHLRDLFTRDARTWSYGIQGSVPILDFGRNWWRVKDAEAQKQRALAVYNKTVQSAFSDIRTALVQQRENAEIVKSFFSQVDSLSRAANLARVRYDNGYSSYLEVLDAERQLFGAEMQAATALAGRLNSIVDVCMALGGGWDDGEEPEEDAPADDAPEKAAPENIVEDAERDSSDRGDNTPKAGARKAGVQEDGAPEDKAPEKAAPRRKGASKKAKEEPVL